MTEHGERREDKQVWCRRLLRHLPIDEHADCPYCFGDRKQIEAGDHDAFCDFRVDRDPINFGFPPDSSRNLSE